MAQIPFDFDHCPALAGEDFLIAPSNEDAIKWVNQWPHWPQSVLVICGPKGSGKTHLAHVFQAESQALMLTFDDLHQQGVDVVLHGQSAVIIEDAETNLADRFEEDLLHLYNLAKESDIKILMTACQPPARWGIALNDLRSRLNTATVAKIKAPDDGLLMALLVKQFADRQLVVDGDILTYMMARMDRSFAAVQDLIAAVDVMALAEKRAISKPLIRRALEKYWQESSGA